MNQDLIEKIRQNLTDGLVVDTYKEMCLLLGQTEKRGKQKEKQLKNWSNYFSYKLWGRKIIIEKIYSTDEITINLLKDQLNDNLIYEMCLFLDAYCEIVDTNIISISISRLAQVIGFINYKYFKYQMDRIDLSQNHFKASSLESDLIKNNFGPVKPYLSDKNLEIYKNKILETRKFQTQVKVNQAFDLKEKEVEKGYTDSELRDVLEIMQAENGTNAVKDLLDNNSKAFTSTDITYNSLFDFYSHINDNLKYKIKKTLRILEDYRIIEDLPCYIGIFKNEDGERYEAPISNQQLDQILKILNKTFENFDFFPLDAIFSVQSSIRSKAYEVLKPLNIEKIYKVHNIVFYQTSLKKNPKFYKKYFEDKRIDENFLTDLFQKNIDAFKQQVRLNYQKRLTKNSKVGRKSTDEIIKTQLYNSFIDILLGIPYNYSFLKLYRDEKEEDLIAKIPNNWKFAYEQGIKKIDQIDGKLGNEIFVLPDNSAYRHMEELEDKYFLDTLDVFTPPQNFCDPDDFVENYIDHFFT